MSSPRPLWRGIGIALALETLVALLVLGACQAAGAPSLAGQAYRVEAVLERHVGPLPDRPVRIGSHEEMATCAGNANAVTALTGCAGLAYAHEIALDEEIVWYLGRRDTDALAVVVHEMLHRPGDASLLDEGAVDALAADLCPVVAQRLWGLRGPCAAPAYPDQVKGVRMASARATGGSARARAARAWRADLWRADQQTRAALYAAAMRGPAAGDALAPANP